MAINRLSHNPFAIFAIVLQEAGAIIITSAHLPNSTWFAHTSPSVRSVSAGFFERVEKVRGFTKSAAWDVMTTFTSAPALISNRKKKTDL